MILLFYLLNNLLQIHSSSSLIIFLIAITFIGLMLPSSSLKVAYSQLTPGLSTISLLTYLKLNLKDILHVQEVPPSMPVLAYLKISFKS